MSSKALLRTVLWVSSLALVSAALAHAQDPSRAREIAGPVAKPGPGTWGAELGIGSDQSATLLRFGSPTSALLLGAEVLWMDVSQELPEFGGTRTERYTLANVTARIGFRRYRGTALALRPFSSLGLLAGYSDNPAGPGWTTGAFGELGASYFFSPDVSLGAVGGLQVIYASSKRRFDQEELAYRQFGIRASAVQLLATVYF